MNASMKAQINNAKDRKSAHRVAPKQEHSGFTLTELMIVIALISFSAAVAAPFWLRARATAQTNGCLKNQQEISFAIGEWALEHRKGQNAPVSYDDIKPYLKRDVFCPAGGRTMEDSYCVSTVAENPACKVSPAIHNHNGDSFSGIMNSGGH